MLIQKRFLWPLEPSLHYGMVLDAAVFNPDTIPSFKLIKKAPFREKQSLASTGLITNEIQFLFCSIFLEEIVSPPPKEEPSGRPLDWGDVISRVFDKIAGVASILALLRDAIKRRRRERSTTHHAHIQQSPSQTSELDIVAIRLRMTHGPDHRFKEWLTDPDRFKHYIDVFNQPSSSILPLKAIFVQRNGKELSVDVSKGTQNNPQLDELLSHLNIDSEQK